jgi:uncharacterized Zn-binding protein involved in type VI secretion
MRQSALYWAVLSACAAFPVSGQVVSNLAAQPASIPAGIGTLVTITCRITDPGVLPSSVLIQRLNGAGAVIGTLGSMRDDGTLGDAVAGDGTFTARPNIYESNPGLLRLRISVAMQGSARRILSSVLDLQVTGAATSVVLLSPAADSYLSLSPVQVQGTIADASLTVVVNGITAAKTGTSFSASVPLIEGANTITAVATSAAGGSATASVQVFLDTTPPRVTITSPLNDSRTTAATLDVSGIVNDIVVGTVNPLQASVTVNNLQAQVANRTFAALNVPLNIGANLIRAEGRDRAGNTFAETITVLRDPPPAGTAAIAVVSGNNQTGPIGTALPQPLVVQLTNAQNQPAPAGTPVTFRVTEGNGLLNLLPAVQVNTDGQGRAQVAFTLGTRAGAGNNRVQAFATGFQGAAQFAASALNGAPAKIIVDSGLNQSGAIGQPLPFAFIAVVTDAGNNRLGGVPVTFNVRTGGGHIANSTAFNTVSDSDGRVAATLTLGLEEGLSNNVVEAAYPGSTGAPAVFFGSAFTPGPASETAISGVVLDNSNQPIPGVTIRLFRLAQAANNVQPVQIGTPVVTDAAGAFRMLGAPVGVMKLMADGATAQPNGAWPTLEYDLVTVAGRDNTVGMPIYLPRLDTVNRLCVTPGTGGTLTLPQVPGFSLTVAPGSATFPGGTRTGCVSVTPVNPDKVPMVPGFGQQPRFVVTIQPVGTLFNPPASIQIPNVDGLAPRAKTEMYSYDHDLAAFVAIGTGTVSDDGSVIASDPGVGVLKAGWHCGGDPNANGTVADCPTCKWCQNNVCVADPAQANRCCNDNGICTAGSCQVVGPDCPARAPITPTINNLGDWPGCTPFGLTEPVIPQTAPTVNACVGGSCLWGFRVTAFTSDIRAGVCAPAGYTDITAAADAAVTAATYCAIMADLTPDGTGRPTRASYWSSPITRRHENFHVTEWRDALNGRWPTFQNAVETLTTAIGPAARTPAQALAAQQATINAQFATLITNAASDWVGAGEDPAYADGKVPYETLVAAICTRAKTAGWAKTNPCAACPP